MKHTPGPWKVLGNAIFTEDDHLIATLRPTEDKNARLIAKAPELLEACKHAIALLRTLPVPSPKDPTGESYWDKRNLIESSIAEVEDF